MPKRIPISALKNAQLRSEMEQRLMFLRRHYVEGPSAEWVQRATAAGFEVRPMVLSKIHLNNSPDVDIFTGRVDAPFVEFSVSTPLILRALYMAVMADPEIFHGFDDVELLAQPFQPDRLCDWAMVRDLARNFSEDKFLAFTRHLQKTGVGAHPGRHYLGVMLSLQAESFLMYHELGHHDYGHVHFKMLMRRHKSTIANTFWHVFELEADENAVNGMFNGFFGENPVTGNDGVTEDMKAMRRMGRKSRWRMWTTTIGILYLLLHFRRPRPLPAGNWQVFLAILGWCSPHPPPLYRLKNAINHARDTLVGDEAQAQQDYQEAVIQAIADLEVVAQRLGLPLTGQISDRYEGIYEEEIMKMYSFMRTELDDFRSKMHLIFP